MMKQTDLDAMYEEKRPNNCENCQHYNDGGLPDEIEKMPWIFYATYCERARRFATFEKMSDEDEAACEAAQTWMISPPGTPADCAGWELARRIIEKWRVVAVRVGE